MPFLDVANRQAIGTAKRAFYDFSIIKRESSILNQPMRHSTSLTPSAAARRDMIL